MLTNSVQLVVLNLATILMLRKAVDRASNIGVMSQRCSDRHRGRPSEYRILELCVCDALFGSEYLFSWAGLKIEFL